MTGKEKSYLRSLAHPLKPVVHLGKQGLTDETQREVDFQLLDHELIKIKVLDSCPLTKKECAEILEKMKKVDVVQIIGKTIVLFRPHPEEPVINLNAA